jgi:hypothetical protein
VRRRIGSAAVPSTSLRAGSAATGSHS